MESTQPDPFLVFIGQKFKNFMVIYGILLGISLYLNNIFGFQHLELSCICPDIIIGGYYTRIFYQRRALITLIFLDIARSFCILYWAILFSKRYSRNSVGLKINRNMSVYGILCFILIFCTTIFVFPRYFTRIDSLEAYISEQLLTENYNMAETRTIMYQLSNEIMMINILISGLQLVFVLLFWNWLRNIAKNFLRFMVQNEIPKSNNFILIAFFIDLISSIMNSYIFILIIAALILFFVGFNRLIQIFIYEPCLIKIPCKLCGTEINPKDKFCKNCGNLQ